MIFVILSITLLFASPVSLLPLMLHADDVYHNRAYSVTIEQDELTYERHHANVLRPKPELDPDYWDDALTFVTKTTNIAGQIVTRSQPLLEGLLVEGGEGVFDEHGDHRQFYFTHMPSLNAEFRLDAAEAVERAMVYQPDNVLREPYVEKLDGLFDRLWLYHFGELRPAYKIRLPAKTIELLQDIYIDADNGNLLKIEPSAQFVRAPANAFVYAPKSDKTLSADLQPVMLTNLIEVKEDGFLQGEYVSVRTCCRYYTCPLEGECTDDKKRCALRSHENVRQTRELLSLPTATLGLDAMISLPPTVYIDTVRCTYLPFARASKRDNNPNVIGFFDKPVDTPGSETDMDRFSEIQAYYSVMSFFNHIRTLLDDKTWCLRPEAMSCNKDGSPVLDENGMPKNPYRVFVNQVIPDMKLNGPLPAPDNFIAQAEAGKGSRENPIVLNDFARLNNAAFVPALSTLKKNTPLADEILSDLIKPFDHNVFFQGDRDFAYDGTVVFHEFMHAITTSLIGKINSLGTDKWGIHSEPGGLNEAWSDYFASSFSNNPRLGEYANVAGGFGEIALRNIDNRATCPADVIGEIHNDGLIWSGALWEIRSRLKEKLSENATLLFDRAVLASLAQAKTTEDFKTQSAKLIDNLKARDGLGAPAVAIAEEVFAKRGLRDCFRVITLASVDVKNKLTTATKPMLFVPSKNQIGLSNYAPAGAQLEIGIPAGAQSLTLHWRQFLGTSGAMLGTETTPNTAKNMVPLSIMSHLNTPIVWEYKNLAAVATDGHKPLDASVRNAVFVNGEWQYSMKIELERCEQKTLYVSLLSNDFKYVLQNLSVSFAIDAAEDRADCDFTGTLRGEMKEEIETGCTTQRPTSTLMLVVGLLLLRLMRSRTIKAKMLRRL